MTQTDALTIMKMGNNVYLTGGAGAGKTYVLNSYIKYLRDHDVSVAVTASTGIAATHIGGMTIHAWSGIGIRDSMSDWDIEMLQEKKYLWDRYEKVQVLIIDEISMLSGSFLDTLDRICRSFKRKLELPFGGIQVILCGDFFQLPPVARGGEVLDQVIDSQVWKNSGLVMCYLTEQHRQNDDGFTELLNAIRRNNVQDYHLETLQSRIREYDAEEFESITKLFTHNADVDMINHDALGRLDEDEYIFHMTSKGKENLVETLKKSCLAPETLRLKIGAEVMFVKNNVEAGYVNGTRGVVVDINEMDLPVVKITSGKEIVVDSETWAIDDNGKILASISQIPLRHAWAITVHKSQGMSLDAAVIDLSKSFAHGMGYVALSRVRNLNGLHLVGFSASALSMDPRILTIDRKLQESSDRAVSRLAELTRDEIKTAHDAFIIQCGGTLEEVKVKKKKDDITTQKTHETTYRMVTEGKSLRDVAEERGLTIGTIIEHLDKARQMDWDINFKHIRPSSEDLENIHEAFESIKDSGVAMGDVKLTPVKKYLDRAGFTYSFDDIKLARLFLDRNI